MKRTIILLACALGIFTANAQSVVESTKFTDNWSVGINAGAITPLTHSAFFKSMRPAFGVGFSKQLTPNFGLGFQGMGYVNTTRSKTAFDVSDVSLLWPEWVGYIIMQAAMETRIPGPPVLE